ncbi:MAG: hypothetical protein COA92_00055 [Sulfurovum sp.]|nr:MAG: hypothetical protein COA92_00055 [Sulfurovum sp.]PHS36711.1 MAG: hypothetical protein COB07_12255 [Sulfurovum sp.]
MKILKKFIQMNLLLFLSMTLYIIPWIPSLMVENIVNFTIMLSYIITAFLVYQMIYLIYHQQKEKKIYRNTLYTFFFLVYIGFFAIIQIGVSSIVGQYVSSYTFGKKIFYVYKNSEMSYEVSIKEKYLPIRSLPLFTTGSTEISLEKRDRYLYAVGENINEKIFDLKENKSLTDQKY